MSNKKARKKTDSKPNTTPHLLPVNIDYDKLAEAFINAQEQRKEKSMEKSSKKIGFFKGVWLILQGKNDTQDRMTMGFMAILLTVLFKTISIIGFLSVPISAYVIIKQMLAMTWTIGWNLMENIIGIILFASFLFIIFIFSVLIWGASKEIEKSEDKHFVVAVFSGIISLVALIISLIALKQ
ncbi:MAG: hypothetical protein LBS36_02965 [Oscillospiraceae bacterium]|jgi:hypothetical protein|nr:hypothetical protein [Oscillospiraceae bacterium]